MDIDVIIPVYKPKKQFLRLLDRLNAQTLVPARIILINTGEEHFDALVAGTDFYEKYPNAEVHHIRKEEFDHGGTRRKAVRLSSAPIFVMMTQDAVPADDKLLEKLTGELVKGLEADERGSASGKKIAVAYARQLADDRCGVLETASREFNYPGEAVTKTAEDLKKLGIKTYFCSDVCAAYRRDLYDRVGGFVRKAIFNEDMIFAAGAIARGYAVRYEADARVIHSHNYSNAQQLHRNFDLGVSQSEHPEVFGNVSSEGEGGKLVGFTTKKLIKEGKVYLLPHFYSQCASKYIGYKLGKNYKRLPEKWLMKLTTNPLYFEKR
ncbi:MAG: glycosyltransferase [Lachnospiraceae bacterium]|nr:glycosyltransferase [Lachnospiraceae bacterium]